jgi:1,4-alpha-glucan branching enzyme
VEHGLDARHAGYFEQDPVYRRWHHHELTFSLCTPSRELHLPLSHDEVVHGKGSLLDKMPATPGRSGEPAALYAYMWAHPGKKLLFMGCEIGQWREWTTRSRSTGTCSRARSTRASSRGARPQRRLPRRARAVGEDFDPTGFWWLEPSAAEDNVIAFARRHRCG